MKDILIGFLKDGAENTVSDNKLIVFLAFLVASGVLIYAAVIRYEHLDTLYIAYCLIFTGLKVTKGYIDTLQKKNGGKKDEVG